MHAVWNGENRLSGCCRDKKYRVYPLDVFEVPVEYVFNRVE